MTHWDFLLKEAHWMAKDFGQVSQFAAVIVLSLHFAPHRKAPPVPISAESHMQAFACCKP
jgi:hypothetical protein